MHLPESRQKDGPPKSSNLTSVLRVLPGEGKTRPNGPCEVALPNFGGFPASVLKFSWASTISSHLQPRRNMNIEINRFEQAGDHRFQIPLAP